MSECRYLIGDTRDIVDALPAESVDLVLTSPPFLALRSYLPADHPDKGREIGSEPTPADFLDTLLDLTESWARVLAPHGSICVELGDTFSGSGSGSQDYTDPASPRFKGNVGQRVTSGSGWPLDKSLCGIPTLYAWSLAYGRNLLRPERTTDPWRVRNVVAWCRPNPPVGALGDKFRPATSYMTIACKARDRYFDLDAVREPYAENTVNNGKVMREGIAGNGPKAASRDGSKMAQRMLTHAGAPPLDWWEIPTEPYAGSHYATWPRQLLVRPIKAMCPERVCRVCGQPSRRIVEANYGGATWASGGRRNGLARQPDRIDLPYAGATLGWSDCGHGSFACGTCKVVVPYDHALRRSGQGTRSQAQVSSEAVLDEPVASEGVTPNNSGHMRAVRGRVSGSSRSTVLHPELFGEVGARGGAGEHDQAAHGDARPQGESLGLRAGVGSRGHARSTAERLHDGAPGRDAGSARARAGAVGDRPPSQRGEGRQPAGEPGSGDASASRWHGDLPALQGDVPGQLTEWSCHACGGLELVYVEDHWRPGHVLDPFAGSGTTLAVASGNGRDATGIDIDARNADLARGRVGMFLTVEGE